MQKTHTRRDFITTATIGVIATALARDAKTQVTDPRPPMIDPTDLREIADGVWVIGDRRIWLVPNIGIVVGRDAVLVVDTGLGPANGEQVFALARRLGGTKKIYLTMTHFHPEHGYGAQVFKRNATIIYNKSQKEELQEKGVRYIDLFRQTQSAAAKTALEGTTITLPDFTYEGPSAALDLGGRVVELRSVGLAHTRGDQVVSLPKEKILFAGDLIEERMFPIFPYFPPGDLELDGDHWVDVIGGFEKYQPRIIVPGHGDLGELAIALNLQRQMGLVKKRVAASNPAGRSVKQTILDIKPAVEAAFPSWEHPEMLDLQIAYYASRMS